MQQNVAGFTYVMHTKTIKAKKTEKTGYKLPLHSQCRKIYLITTSMLSLKFSKVQIALFERNIQWDCFHFFLLISFKHIVSYSSVSLSKLVLVGHL